MPHGLRSRLALAASLLAFAPGCFPTRGDQPTHTFRLEEHGVTCTRESLSDTSSPLWTSEDRRVLDQRTADGELAVASVLGCHVEILDDCHTHGEPGAQGEMLAKDLEGPCTNATHVVRSVRSGHAELQPLSLGDYRVTGTFRGVMTQPNGPYETYDATMYLTQDGPRVSGVTRLATLDREYWGDLLFEGQLEGNVLFFADAAVLDDNLGVTLAWCAKGGYLVVDPRDGHLSGPWRASFCEPGSLDLRSVPDRPHVVTLVSASSRALGSSRAPLRR